MNKMKFFILVFVKINFPAQIIKHAYEMIDKMLRFVFYF